MMNVTIIAVGKLKERYLRDGCGEYIKRLSAYCKLNLIEIPEERSSDQPSKGEIEMILQKEGERIASKISKGTCVVPLCIEGREYTSPEFSRKLEMTVMENGSVTFIIGGSYGLSPRIKELAAWNFSLGKITLPHQLARMVLLEQIYRGFSIINHSKYHK